MSLLFPIAPYRYFTRYSQPRFLLSRLRAGIYLRQVEQYQPEGLQPDTCAHRRAIAVGSGTTIGQERFLPLTNAPAASFLKHLSFSKQPLPVPCRDTTKSTSAEAPSKTSPKKPYISLTPASPALSANIGSRARMGSTKHLRSEFWLYSRNISTCIRRPQARLHPLLGTSRGRKSASLDRSVSFSVRLPPDFPLNAVRKHAAESSPTPIVKNGQNSL